MKKISQARAWGINLHDFDVPKFAIYGEIGFVPYICTDLYPRKDHYYNIWVFVKSRWTKTTTKEYPRIRSTLAEFMHSDKFTRCKTIKRDYRQSEKYQKMIGLSECVPRERLPQTKTGYTFDCYNQGQVEGKGHISNQYELTSGLDLEDYKAYDVTIAPNRALFSSFGDDTKQIIRFRVEEVGIDTIPSDYLNNSIANPCKDWAKNRNAIKAQAQGKVTFKNKDIGKNHCSNNANIKDIKDAIINGRMSYDDMCYIYGNTSNNAVKTFIASVIVGYNTVK